MDQSEWLHIINFGLVVLIWLVQLIIYPSFAQIRDAEFSSWHRRYVRKITAVVAPLMLAQLLLIIMTLINRPDAAAMLMLACVLGIWLTSFTLSVPCHKQLQDGGKNDQVIQRLVRTNWIRTILWTGVFLIGIFFH